MVADVRGLETGLLGLEGFRLAGTVEKDGEVLAAVETTAVRAWCEGCGQRAASKGRRETLVQVSACGRASGGAGVAETPLAVPRRRVRGEVLDRGQRGGAVSVGAVRTRPQRSSAPSRSRRNVSSGGGSGAGGQLAYRDESRP